jgi:hypothetical protein
MEISLDLKASIQIAPSLWFENILVKHLGKDLYTIKGGLQYLFN